MTQVRVMEAICARLMTLPVVPELPVAWEGVDFTPPTDGSGWLRVQNFPAVLGQIDLGSAGQNRLTGRVQIDVFWPLGVGIFAPWAVAELIVTHFKRGTTMTQGGQVVKVFEPPLIRASLTDDRFVQIPVDVIYSADIAN